LCIAIADRIKCETTSRILINNIIVKGILCSPGLFTLLQSVEKASLLLIALLEKFDGAVTDAMSLTNALLSEIDLDQRTKKECNLMTGSP